MVKEERKVKEGKEGRKGRTLVRCTCRSSPPGSEGRLEGWKGKEKERERKGKKGEEREAKHRRSEGLKEGRSQGKEEERKEGGREGRNVRGRNTTPALFRQTRWRAKILHRQS